MKGGQWDWRGGKEEKYGRRPGERPTHTKKVLISQMNVQLRDAIQFCKAMILFNDFLGWDGVGGVRSGRHG